MNFNVPDVVISFFDDLLQYLKGEDFSVDEMNLIVNAEHDINNYPTAPENFISISFRLHDVSYSAFYSDYKVEISDYISENNGDGYDHFQTNVFRYSPVDTEESGEIYQFIDMFMVAIKEVNTKEISVSDEE